MRFQASARVLGQTFEVEAASDTLFIEAAFLSAHVERLPRNLREPHARFVGFRGGFDATLGSLRMVACLKLPRARRTIQEVALAG